jgi:DNA-binding transcriptional ArsR family regulator
MKLDTAANLLARIGNPTRLKIVRLLVRAGDDGLPVGQIQKRLGIPGSTLTHHIGHLKNAGVIRQRREQATLICTVDYDVIRALREQATLICTVDYDVIRALVDYLTEECCADQQARDDAA